jgi:predicted metal-dependent phosphoesterase TrpH
MEEVYRGDCHLHSVLSRGANLSPEQLAAEAWAAGLDFAAVTEHNTVAAHELWEQGAGKELLVILGQEVVTDAGHWLALGLSPGRLVDWHHDSESALGERLSAVQANGGLCVVAHPYAPYDTGTFEHPYGGFDAVEVWNGEWASDLPWQADNEAALAAWSRRLAEQVDRARWLPAIGNSDAHLAGQVGTPHTVVRAQARTAQAVLSGLRAGRSWIAGSPDVDLSFSAQAGADTWGIGERVKVQDRSVRVRCEVRGVPSGALSFHTAEGLVHTATLPGGGAGVVECALGRAAAQFIRVEVRHPTGSMAAMSNPIFLA